MNKLVFWALIAILGSALISGCGGGKKAGGTIVGKVNDMFYGKGVEGAKVILTSDDGSVFMTTTDSSGNFIFSGLSPGSYGAKLTKAGYFDRKVSGIKVEEGKETKAEIGMLISFGGT